MILPCNHKTTSDFSFTEFSGEKVIHKYCNTCGMHFYRDREYTKKEWDSWIESCDFKD